MFCQHKYGISHFGGTIFYILYPPKSEPRFSAVEVAQTVNETC